MIVVKLLSWIFIFEMSMVLCNDIITTLVVSSMTQREIIEANECKSLSFLIGGEDQKSITYEVMMVGFETNACQPSQFSYSIN